MLRNEFFRSRFVCGLGLIILGLVLLGTYSWALAQEKPTESGAKTDRIVTIPKDETQFKIKVGEFVRVSGEGPSGMVEITSKSEGPIKPISTSVMRTVARGHLLIGEFIKEFEFKADQKGEAKIIVSIENKVQKKTEKKEFNIKIE
jgi:hypothetical protein